jgi:hypothetical protein
MSVTPKHLHFLVQVTQDFLRASEASKETVKQLSKRLLHIAIVFFVVVGCYFQIIPTSPALALTTSASESLINSRTIALGNPTFLGLVDVTSIIGKYGPVGAQLIQKGSKGDYAVISYDWTGKTAREILRTTNVASAVARAESAGAYSAVVFSVDDQLPIYYNQASDFRSKLSVLGDLEDFFISGKFLDYPDNLKGIFELAINKGYCYDGDERLNKNLDRISGAIDRLFRQKK